MSTWSALGGGELRHGRGKAFWRSGDSYNVAIDSDKNVWFDHRDAVGGGILDLVQVALGCDQREAIRWLVDNCGLEDSRDERTPQERAQARREREETDRYEASFQDSYRAFERELEDRRDELVRLLRDRDDDALELELEICYQRIDAVRRLIRRDDADYDDPTIRLARAIIDRIAEEP